MAIVVTYKDKVNTTQMQRRIMGNTNEISKQYRQNWRQKVQNIDDIRYITEDDVLQKRQKNRENPQDTKACIYIYITVTCCPIAIITCTMGYANPRLDELRKDKDKDKDKGKARQGKTNKPITNHSQDKTRQDKTGGKAGQEQPR